MNKKIGEHTIKGIGMLIMALVFLAACGAETEDAIQDQAGNLSVDDVMNDNTKDELEDRLDEADETSDMSESEIEEVDNSIENEPTNYSYTMITYSKVGDEPAQKSTTQIYVKEAAYYMRTDKGGYFFHPEEQSLAMYSVEDNSLIIMADDSEPTEDRFSTPWDTASGIEEDMYSDEFFEGEEKLNGVMTRKYIYAIEDTAVTAYYDTENKIVAKVQYDIDDTTTYIEFQNYEEGTVTDADLAYPEGATVTDLRELGEE